MSEHEKIAHENGLRAMKELKKGLNFEDFKYEFDQIYVWNDYPYLNYEKLFEHYNK